jgi:superoxide oxidase
MASSTALKPRAASRFDQVSIALHWLTLLLVLNQFATAWMVDQSGAGGGNPALWLAVHRSSGIATWIVVASRLAWRRLFAHLPPFPANMPRVQQWAAKANEYGLYALLLLQPLTGLGDTLFRGRPFVVFGQRVPALAAPDKPLFHALHGAHEAGAIALAVLIGLHAAAALLHGLVLRDGVFGRMLPWTAR